MIDLLYRDEAYVLISITAPCILIKLANTQNCNSLPFHVELETRLI